MTIASTLHMHINALVLLLSVILAVLSVPAALILFESLIHIKTVCTCFVKHTFKIAPLTLSYLGLICTLLLISTFQFISIQYCATGISTVFSFSSWVSSVLLLIVLNSIFAILFFRWKIGLIGSSIVISLWNIADYYTIMFHGSPLFLSEFANTGTAAAVAMNYTYRLSWEIVFAVLILIEEIIIIRRSKSLFDTDPPKTRFLKKSCVLLISVLLFIPSYKYTIKKYNDWMPWDQSVFNCGFLIMNIEDVTKKRSIVNEPEGYNTFAINEYFVADSVLPQATLQYPDIILILNESLCDLDFFTDLYADPSPLSDIYSIENIISGYAVAPNVGGGTNNSEFELLMSKSNLLLKSGAPFTFLTDYQLERSAVKYLNSLGYSTIAMHCEDGRNYNRNIAYPVMGFDEVLLGRDSFKYYAQNSNRPGTDMGNYKDLIHLFETATDNRPCFYYLLTFQNHGGYEQNDPSSDSVHIGKDFGNLTDDIEEYLSSIKLSAEAFKALTEYFSTVNREVIICMVGDHAPSFIGSLPYAEDRTIMANDIAKRVVPFFIWANYELQPKSCTDFASMTDLVPIVLEAAGMPLTPYYSYILKLHNILPVRTSNGLYMDNNGNIGGYSVDSPYYDILSKYYYLEYNSLLSDDYYCQDIFELN